MQYSADKPIVSEEKLSTLLQHKKKSLVQYEQKIKEVLTKYVCQIKEQKKSLQQIIEQIVLSQELNYWIVLRQILIFIQNEQIVKSAHSLSPTKQSKLNQCAKIMERSINAEITISMKIFMYSWLKQNKTLTYINSFSKYFKKLVSEGKLTMFNSWITESQQSNDRSTLQTIKMIVRCFPSIFTAQRLSIQQAQLEFIIYLLAFVDIHTQQQLIYFDHLLCLIKQFRVIYSYYRAEQKEEHIILRILLQVAKNDRNSGNLSWFFFPCYLPKPQIKSYILFYSQQILNYTDIELIKIFKNLFRTSLEQNALILLDEASRLLKQSDKLYQLKAIYQNIILPIIIRRAKSCLKAPQLVFQIASYYIVGFYSHCNIGLPGLMCILSNIVNVQNQKIRSKWIQLALLVAQKNNQTNIVFKELQKQGVDLQIIKILEKHKTFQAFNDKQIWNICARDARKSKNYIKQKSKVFKGIQNKSSECYIISIVQSLFTTKQLPNILKEYKLYRRNQVCFHLKEIFQSMQTLSIVSVRSVKQSGPKDFRLSRDQQDAQQYLIKLFQQIQEQLSMEKQRILLEQLFKSFRIKIKRTIQCRNCKNIIQMQQNQYIHTISYNTSLCEETTQDLNDYECQHCDSLKVVSIIKLESNSKILFVHINRFSYSESSKSKKQMSTRPIKRDFMNYRLQGIIFHIGKTISSGHYVYYHNVQSKKWVQMNDKNVYQFNLQHQNQQFQKQLKAQCTPYLLVYKKKA